MLTFGEKGYPLLLPLRWRLSRYVECVDNRSPSRLRICISVKDLLHMELMYVTHQLRSPLTYIHSKLNRRSYKLQSAQAVILVYLDRMSVA